MTRILITAALAAALFGGRPVAAQRAGHIAGEEEIRRQYAPIDESVVRIRTIARLETRMAALEEGRMATVSEPLSVYGSGVVIGSMQVEGRTEYLIITNHHVADASNYVIQDGRFLRENKHNTRAVPNAEEQSYVVSGEREEVAPDDIRIVELARNVRGDMALLRTVGAQRELVPFTGAIGYRTGEIAPGATIVTSGFPYTGGKVLAVGRVVEVDRLHELGQPHVDFTVALPVERGQSGSPVFAAELEDGEVRYTLIGLVHAAEGHERFMVPFELWQNSLDGVRAVLGDRLPR